jgi:hypothetical protein
VTQAQRIAKLEDDVNTAVWLLAEVSVSHNRLAAIIGAAIAQQIQQQLLQHPQVQQSILDQLNI